MFQFLILVVLDIDRSINSHQGSTTIMVNPSTHHGTITFQNTFGDIMMLKDSWMSICSEQHEARFIRKENSVEVIQWADAPWERCVTQVTLPEDQPDIHN